MIHDLRWFLSRLGDERPNDFVDIEDEVDPKEEAIALLRNLEARRGDAVVRFNRIKGAAMPVVANVHASPDRLAFALGTTREQLNFTYAGRLERHIPPQLVLDGPVQEHVFTGEQADLGMLPLLTPFADCPAPYISGGIMVVKDCETGIRNLSYIRLMKVGPRTMTMNAAPFQHTDVIMRNAAKRGIRCEAAIILGYHPAIGIGALAKVPFNVDEYDCCGALLGAPVPLVKCRTVDLEVPAHAEIVIEAEIAQNEMVSEGPYGEFTGYALPAELQPTVHIKAITHRTKPIYQDVVAGAREHLLPRATPLATGAFRGPPFLPALRVRRRAATLHSSPLSTRPHPLMRTVLIALALVSLASLRAEITLAAPFRDGAVLQRGKAVPIWGRATPGEAVLVEFAGQSLRTTADAGGRWGVHLAPMPANAMPGRLVVMGSNRATVSDILVGEVWLCSGQSNMNMAVRQAQDAEKEIAEADYPLIRHFVVKSEVADEPVGMADGEWQVCTPRNAGGFTAAGYFFARELHRRLAVPIGIMKATLGGSPVEGWLSAEALASDPAFAVVGQRWQELKPKVPKGNRNQPAGLYNGLIHPLEPFALAGFLWYQGEGNAERASEYEKLFSTMIRQWRRDFGQGDLPFIFAQLPKWQPREGIVGHDWPALRAAQAAVAAAVTNTFMAVTLDAGDKDDLHPKNKQEVGRRLALLAAAKVYGQPVEASGPVFKRAEGVGSVVRVYFDHAEGLRINGDAKQGFEIAGADGKYEAALVFEEGASLWVESGRVTQPTAVRFAWRNLPETYLYNKAGLPAAPFAAKLAATKPLARFPVVVPSPGTKQTMWPEDEFAAPPKTFPVEQPGFTDDGEIRPLFYEGPPLKGRPTKVFAWIGVPKNRQGKVPGMVLVHGGGGTAYRYWTKLWVDRGYAAVAMDTSGSMPPSGDGSRAERGQPHTEGGPRGWGNFNSALEPVRDQWMYHAVSAVIRGHSLLRSLPAVDPDRIGITGISWGGTITCTVVGIDPRFKLAVPVYGCGFLGENSFFLETSIQSIAPKLAQRWVDLWDPSQYVGGARMPMLFVNGTNDKHFRPVVWQRTYGLVKAPVTLSLQIGLRHGHPPTGDPKEIAVYVDSILRGGAPLPTVIGSGHDGEKAWVRFASGVPIASAELVYTCDGAGWPAREWKSAPAELSAAKGRAEAVLPDDVTAWFFNIRDDRGCTVSSPHIQPNPVRNRER